VSNAGLSLSSLKTVIPESWPVEVSNGEKRGGEGSDGRGKLNEGKERNRQVERKDGGGRGVGEAKETGKEGRRSGREGDGKVVS
jgi:hypothetical protein